MEKLLYSSLLENFERTRIKADPRVTQIEGCLRQIYEFRRNLAQPILLKHVFICRKGQKFGTPHLQVVVDKTVYDPCFDFLHKKEGDNIYISEMIGELENNDIVAKHIRKIVTRALLEYSLYGGFNDYRMCLHLPFDRYLNYHKKIGL
jgi:hypothetical protein